MACWHHLFTLKLDTFMLRSSFSQTQKLEQNGTALLYVAVSLSRLFTVWFTFNIYGAQEVRETSPWYRPSRGSSAPRLIACQPLSPQCQIRLKYQSIFLLQQDRGHPPPTGRLCQCWQKTSAEGLVWWELTFASFISVRNVSSGRRNLCVFLSAAQRFVPFLPW